MANASQSNGSSNLEIGQSNQVSHFSVEEGGKDTKLSSEVLYDTNSTEIPHKLFKCTQLHLTFSS